MDEGLQILASLTSRGRFGKIFMFPFIWKCWEQKLLRSSAVKNDEIVKPSISST